MDKGVAYLSEAKCYLCLRIPASEIFRVAHELLKIPIIRVRCEQKRIRVLARTAVSLIELSYRQTPTLWCGRTSRAIIGSLLCLLAEKDELYPIKWRLSDKIGITYPTLESCSKVWRENFPEYCSVAVNRL